MSDETPRPRRGWPQPDELVEHPLVTRLIGDAIDRPANLAAYIGYLGRGTALGVDDPGEAVPLRGPVRLYTSPLMDEYLELQAEDIKAHEPLPGDLRHAIWVTDGAPIRRVVDADRIGGGDRAMERDFLSGPVTATHYSRCCQPDPCAPRYTPTTGGGWSDIGGGFDPSSVCKKGCPSP